MARGQGRKARPPRGGGRCRRVALFYEVWVLGTDGSGASSIVFIAQRFIAQFVGLGYFQVAVPYLGHVPVGFLLFKLSGRKQVSFLAVVEKGTCASSRLVVLQTKLLLCGGDGVDASKTTGGRQSISPTLHLLHSGRIYIFRVFHGLSVDRKLTRGDCG